jgi:hypothetical protein
MAVNEWAGNTSVPQYISNNSSLGIWCNWTFTPTVPGNKLFVPYFSNSYFLSRVDALMAAISSRYDRDPRVAYMDIGIYGHWGEGHMYQLCLPLDPVPIRNQIVDIVVSRMR